jgi:hypothetical protein
MGKDRRRPGRTVKPFGTRRRAGRRRRSDAGDRAFPVRPLQVTLSLHEPLPASVLVEMQLELARITQAIEELPESYRPAARRLPPRVLSFLELAVLAQGATHPQLTPAERKTSREEIERLLKQLFPRIVGRPTKDLKDEWLLGDIKVAGPPVRGIGRWAAGSGRGSSIESKPTPGRCWSRPVIRRRRTRLPTISSDSPSSKGPSPTRATRKT